MASNRGINPESERWIVLGDPGISYGPLSRKEAERFAAQYPTRIALSWAEACSQIEICAKYGLPFKPMEVNSGL